MRATTVVDLHGQRHEVVVGAAVGLDAIEGLLFDPVFPHTYCRICGAVYQHDADRNPEHYLGPDSSVDDLAELMYECTIRRKAWSQKHATRHPARMHEQLAKSGLWLFPDAAVKLASFGILPLTDMATSTEIASALRASSSVPSNDSEG